MRFSKALEECMKGKRITRKDWNGRGQFVYYNPPHDVDVRDWLTRNMNAALTDSERLQGVVHIAGHFDMMNAQSVHIIGWIPTQTDMASDQWEVL